MGRLPSDQLGAAFLELSSTPADRLGKRLTSKTKRQVVTVDRPAGAKERRRLSADWKVLPPSKEAIAPAITGGPHELHRHILLPFLAGLGRPIDRSRQARSQHLKANTRSAILRLRVPHVEGMPAIQVRAVQKRLPFPDTLIPLFTPFETPSGENSSLETLPPQAPYGQ